MGENINKQYHTVETVSKSIKKIPERCNIDTHKYMTAHCVAWDRNFNKKWPG
jgi:hypothetical protein